MIETLGTVPVITDDKEKVEWLNTLVKCMKESEDELHLYMKEKGGPLTGFGINYEGYLFIEFDGDTKESIDEATIEDLYNIIDTDAKDIGIDKPPVVFKKEITVLNARTDDIDPLIGGIDHR
ncbi:hypothetical protein [Methanolobus bombayensis]|uniref:hypothetical protein n=1 Tax=Methanolobus bombayensis TaxID=38023 RepID=UPI001AE307AA|nr:hypothetical protein [Methanolobus bombayensis]MBP1909162.1 hypothetical protein [Methanolobus bombayensis]